MTSTLVNTRPDEWVDGVRMHDRRVLGPWRLIRALVRDGRHGRTLILLGSVDLGARYADLIAALLLRLLRADARIVVTDATWEFGSAALADRLSRHIPVGAPLARRALEWISRGAIRLLDGPQVIYCVLSTTEAAEFAARWRIDPERVRFTPFCITMSPDQLAEPPEGDRGIFAGGNPVRDYDTLIAALEDKTEVPAVIATSAITAEEDRRLPESIEAGPVSHERFVEEMRRAKVVVTPLDASVRRSAGQQTYLNAMALGKVVIVSDTPGVRDHVEDGVTGYVVPAADAAALGDAISRALDPERAEAHREMGSRARQAVMERFTTEHYLRRLLQVAQEHG